MDKPTATKQRKARKNLLKQSSAALIVSNPDLATEEAKDVTAQFLYASGCDICIYERPFQLPGPHQFIRKDGKWTVDEIAKVLPTLIRKR